MTLVSLPFLYDYFSNGGSVKYIRTVPNLAVAANRFFQSYMAVYGSFFSSFFHIYSYSPKK